MLAFLLKWSVMTAATISHQDEDPFDLSRFDGLVREAIRAFRSDSSYATAIAQTAQKQAARRKLKSVPSGNEN